MREKGKWSHIKTGQRFGNLIILCQNSKIVANRKRWSCRCDCGDIKIVDQNNLVTGHTKSCGCLKIKVCKERVITHNDSNSKEYRAWQNLKNRCSNSNCSQYKNYGGRGIKVCVRWEKSYENFLKDIGRAPSRIHSIDRVNNNGNYSPKNCKWSTHKEQAHNQRKTVVFNGENASDAAKRLGGGAGLIHLRLRSGWSKEKAFTTQVIKKMRNKKYGNTGISS